MSPNTRKGFTMVEVILFLSLSAAILIGLIAGTSSSIARQRYNDAVQDFTSFLQRQYSGVLNVQNSRAAGGGQSGQAVYGRLIVFSGNTTDSGSHEVYAWNVVGDAKTSAEVKEYSDTEIALEDVNLRVACASTETYSTQWGSTIETTSNIKTPFTGSVLIVRSPLSGVIYTYYSANQVFNHTVTGACRADGIFTSGIWKDTFGIQQFQRNQDINFCLANPDNLYGGNRRNIRIEKDNHSISSINLIPLDEASNRCK